jgi:hypothetical protein
MQSINTFLTYCHVYYVSGSLDENGVEKNLIFAT